MIAGAPHLVAALVALAPLPVDSTCQGVGEPTVVATTMARRDSLPPDRWLGADKVQHALLSGATLAFSFAGMRAAGIDRRPALVGAVVPTAIVAFGKEIRDRRVTGRFSVRDLLADAVGAGAYAAILARTVR